MHGAEGHANKWSIPLKRLSFAPLGLAVGLAVPQLAAAQTTNFHTVGKVACVPEKVTRCSSDDKCESRDASPKDKSEVLVIDFTAKKASVRTTEKLQEFGEIAGDEVSGEERRFSIRQPGVTDDSKALKLTLSRSGKLTLLLDSNRHRAEATCTAES